MHIGASAALESPNIASRSAEEWISEETSRAEAAPAPEVTVEASSEVPDSPAGAAGAATGAAASSDDFFDEAPMPWLKDSISSSRSSPDSSSTGAYEPVSS